MSGVYLWNMEQAMMTTLLLIRCVNNNKNNTEEVSENHGARYSDSFQLLTCGHEVVIRRKNITEQEAKKDESSDVLTCGDENNKNET
jgi:hypothetical protein